mmetsp:Transcript_31948/g.55049  ORF Transcript_31948/g.55049 Transcript_31948/m.55049 type:complete len:476 (+) Transcript_31948:281-1708(+)
MWSWNACMMCFDYFTAQFGQPVLNYAYPWIFCLPWAVFQTLVFFFAYSVSYTYRVAGTFTLTFLLLLVIVPCAAYLEGSTGYYVIAAIFFVLGANTSVMSASVLGLASMLPAKYIGGVSTGFCLAGVLSCILKILFNLVFKPGSFAATCTFLLVSAVFSLLCVGAVIYLENNEFANHYFSVSNSPASPARSPTITQRLLPGRVGTKLSKTQDLLASPKGFSMKKLIDKTRKNLSRPSEAVQNFDLNFDSGDDLPDSNSQKTPTSPLNKTPLKPIKESYGAKASLRRVCRRVLPLMLLIAILEAQTFLHFPGLIVKSQHPGLSFDWVLIIHISLFCFFNLVGRMLVELHVVALKWLYFIVALRFIYLWIWPMTVITCPYHDVQLGDSLFISSSIFAASWFKFIASALFGTVHGYVSTCLLMKAPSRVGQHCEDPESEMEMAGHLMSCMLTLGMLVGMVLCHLLYFNYDVPKCVVTY